MSEDSQSKRQKLNSEPASNDDEQLPTILTEEEAVAEFNNSSAKLSKNAATLFAQKVQRELSKQEPPTIEQVLAMQDHCRSIGMDHRYIGSSPVYREICNLPAKADAQEKPKENATNLVLRELLELLVQDRREADELFKRFDD